MAPRRKTADTDVPADLVRSVDAGTLADGPVRTTLLAARPAMVGLLNAVCAATWVDDPLTAARNHGADAVKQLIGPGSGWKYAYAQRLAESAADAVKSAQKQYLGRLRGCLGHAGETSDRGGPFLVPEGLAIAEAELAALRGLSADGAWLKAAKARAAGHPSGLTAAQDAVLGACHTFVLERCRRPTFAEVGPKGTDSFAVQIRLDDRMQLGWTNKGKAMFAALNTAMNEAFGGGARTFTWTLRLTALFGPGEMAVPVTIARDAWDEVRRDREAKVSGLALEIGPDAVRVRATLRLPRGTPDVARFAKSKKHKLTIADFQELADAVNARNHLLGRDPGMTNTLSWMMVRRDRPVTAEMLQRASRMGKAEALSYLSTHCHDVSNVVMAGHFSGRGFLDHVAGLAKTVDGLRSKIDRGYKKLAGLRACLATPLKLAPADHVPETVAHPDPFVRHLAARFHRLLASIRKLKALRRGTYDRVAAVKKCWFGCVTNCEAELARVHDAAVVREDSGFTAIPTDDPKYKGRTFNKMLNNGSRGQVERTASGKLEWMGIPEVRLPSFYGSVSDWRHAVVDAKQRRGATFTSAVDGMVHQSDEWSAGLYAQFLLMTPKAASGGSVTNGG